MDLRVAVQLHGKIVSTSMLSGDIIIFLEDGTMYLLEWDGLAGKHTLQRLP